MQSFTNKDKNKNNFFFLILGWLGFFIFIFIFIDVEIRAFIVVVLKILTFSTLKNYIIYFTTSLYNTPSIKCLIYIYIYIFNTLFKII